MKRKMFLWSTVVLALLVFAPSVWSAGILNMPDNPVHLTHSGWLEGTMGSTMDVTLSEISGDYEVKNGTYPAWCAENHSHAMTEGSFNLYDSTGSLPAELAGKPWDKINYLLNHKMGGSVCEIQRAVWRILDTYYDWSSSIDDCGSDSKVDAIVTGVNANGDGFDPKPGQIVAVLILNNGFFNYCNGDQRCQDTFFEVIVPEVPEGCTLTPGYWKTHSIYAKPSKYDPTWNGKENTPFYASGKTWYEVLKVPKGGNAYYILAFQYIAAVLNGLAGASTTPDVDDALKFAKNFFETYTPSTKLSKAYRNEVISFADTLDRYNNGHIGPGHCSD